MAIMVKRVTAYEITDSNGNPTIEAEMLLSNGFKITSSISSDNVINTYGMRELRDNDMQHYQGLGVKNAVATINNTLGPKFVNMNPADQIMIDTWLDKADSSEDKSALGINTIAILSQLFAKSGAYCYGVPVYRYVNEVYKKVTKEQLPLEKVPTPCIGMLAGGKNADFKEFHLIPSSSLSFSQAYEMCVDIFHSIKGVMEQLGISYSRSLYGEYIPDRTTNVDMIDIIFDVVQRKNLKLGKHVFFGLTLTAGNYFLRGKYNIKDRPNPLTPNEYYDFLTDIIGKYSVLMLEDPFATNEVDGWRKMFVNFSEQIYIMAHKFIGEHVDYLEDMDNQKMFTSIVIKPTYFGTLSSTLKAVARARKNGMTYMVSADKNETNDDFLADFAMAIQADFIKFGAPAQGERVEKYNRLLKIEQLAKMSQGTRTEQKPMPTRKPINATPLPAAMQPKK